MIQKKCLNFVCLNIRSIRNKTLSLYHFIVSQNVDVLALTETWLCDGPDDLIVINNSVPPGYHIHCVNRQHKRGGGVALIYKKDITFKDEQLTSIDRFSQFELLDCCTKINKISTRVVVVYRQGSGFPVARWPEASQKAVGPARAILWLARLASHNFSSVLSVFVFISVNDFSNKCSLTR